MTHYVLDPELAVVALAIPKIVTVGYRLAPEHPYPAALEDSYAALQWAGGKAGEYGIDPDRLGVLGERSGAGLAAALSLLARDRQGTRLIAQFLDAPTVDDRLTTPSMTTLSDTTMWQSVNAGRVEAIRRMLRV